MTLFFGTPLAFSSRFTHNFLLIYQGHACSVRPVKSENIGAYSLLLTEPDLRAIVRRFHKRPAQLSQAASMTTIPHHQPAAARNLLRRAVQQLFSTHLPGLYACAA